jgi:Protein involved in biosynthesis of mitomycin antibiotics/polyketide fumonisin
LRLEIAQLFQGSFSKQTYPDEWYWREEISKPDATRHMSNSWKSSYLMERIALWDGFGRLVLTLGDWSGARLAMDTLWWKTAGGKPIAFHQDTSFMECFTPARTITVWITLTDTAASVGTLEYAKGSHNWPLCAPPKQFHALSDYRAPMLAAANAADIEEKNIQVVPVELCSGSISIHSGELWHGSGHNVSLNEERIAIGLHYLPYNVVFNELGKGYIFRRYQINGSTALNDTFFPRVA